MAIKFIKTANPNNKFDVTDVTISVKDEADIYEIMQAFEEFMLAQGYQPETIKSMFGDRDE